MKTLRFLAILAATLLAGPALARTAPVPALWVVRDADTTIYLFGTIHALKPRLRWFGSAVRRAFDASDTLVEEIALPDPAAIQAIARRYTLSTDGSVLTATVPAPRRAAFTAAVTGLGLPADALDAQKPWAAANMLTLLSLVRAGFDPQSGVDATLSAAAKAQHKPVEGLETLDRQFGYFDALPKSVQIAFLLRTIDDLPKTGRELDAMIGQWSEGDPAALAKDLNASLKTSPLLYKVLLADRNARWADWIATRLKTPGTVFVAVGAGHLAGRDSVQANLARRHLGAVRIRY